MVFDDDVIRAERKEKKKRFWGVGGGGGEENFHVNIRFVGKRFSYVLGKRRLVVPSIAFMNLTFLSFPENQLIII